MACSCTASNAMDSRSESFVVRLLQQRHSNPKRKTAGYRGGQNGAEFMFDWQANPELIRRARWRQMLHIFKPTVQQYDRFPLPRGLRWVYVVPRLVDVLYQARVRTRKRPR